MGRKIALALSLAVLFITGVIGIYNGITERSTGATNLQKSVTVGVFLYGLLGLASAYGLARRRGWSLGTVAAWALVITYVPGAAVIAYAKEASPIGSALVASAASALIALGIVWTARVMTQGSQSPAGRV